MVTRAVVDDFLAADSMAFVGASRDPKAFSSSVYRELREHGYRLFPVNPNADEVSGDPCARSVPDLPPGLDRAFVMVPADQAADVVAQCIDRGMTKIWLHKGVGPSSVSAEAVERCRRAGVAVVDGACPLMFLEPTAWIHRVHRVELRLTGRLDRRQAAGA